MFGLESYFHDVTRDRNESKKCPRKKKIILCSLPIRVDSNYSRVSLDAQKEKPDSGRVDSNSVKSTWMSERVGSNPVELAWKSRLEN